MSIDRTHGRRPPSLSQLRANFVIVVLVVLGLIIAFGSWYTVDAGQRAVVLRLGAIQSVTGPGLHLKAPLIETVHKIDTRVTRLQWTAADAVETYSKDQQPAHLQLTIAFRVIPNDQSVRTLYTEYRDLNNFAQSIIIPRTMEGIKTVFGQFNAVTVIQERARFNQEVEKAVRVLIKGPVSIEGVQIQDIAFSDAYENSVEQRMQAQVEVERVQQNKAREQLQADIKVIQATAEAQSVKLRGEAEAAAIKARADALRENPQLVLLTATEKWNGVLPTTMVPGSAVPFVNVPGVAPER
jgi:regulator of protease activity HflC (stomatin/prohibitin superfamily)